MSNRRTQEDRVLWLLQASFPNWVPAPSLAKISLQYGRAIHSLRHRRHFQIQNRVRTRNGVKCGEFRLATPGSWPNPKRSRNAIEKQKSSDSLFCDLSLERYPD